MKKRQSKSLFRSGRVNRTKRICQNAVNIEALEERRLLTVFSVGTKADSGAGSLRQAIQDANSTPGADTISFQIGSGQVTISLNAALPAVTDPLVIDGSTQPGYAGSPLIWIARGAASASSHGLELQGSGSQISALAITGFHDGIVLAGLGGHSVQGSFIGISPDGTAPLGNSLYGIDVQSDGNTIGGTVTGQGNVIGLNGDAGIHVSGNGTTIQGNSIGTDGLGLAGKGNGKSGIDVQGGAQTLIGGTAAGARNVIAKNHLHGIELNDATGTTVAGNYIGVDPTGNHGLGNDDNGIYVSGPSAESGVVIDRNVISGNDGHGILLDGAGGVVITGNMIGTDASGLVAGGALNNSGDHIGLESASDGIAILLCKGKKRLQCRFLTFCTEVPTE